MKRIQIHGEGCNFVANLYSDSAEIVWHGPPATTREGAVAALRDSIRKHGPKEVLTLDWKAERFAKHAAVVREALAAFE